MTRTKRLGITALLTLGAVSLLSIATLTGCVASGSSSASLPPATKEAASAFGDHIKLCITNQTSTPYTVVWGEYAVKLDGSALDNSTQILQPGDGQGSCVYSAGDWYLTKGTVKFSVDGIALETSTGNGGLDVSIFSSGGTRYLMCDLTKGKTTSCEIDSYPFNLAGFVSSVPYDRGGWEVFDVNLALMPK